MERFKSSSRKSDIGGARAAAGWQIHELVLRPNADRDYVFGDELADATKEDLALVFREIGALAAAGVPPDRTLGSPQLQGWTKKCRGEHHKTKFWVLKTKPGPWRLYFYVDETTRQAIGLLAVQKKTDERDEQDFQKCCERLSKFRDGTAKAVPFDDWRT